MLFAHPTDDDPHARSVIIDALNKGQGYAVLTAEFTPQFAVSLRLEYEHPYLDERFEWKPFRYVSRERTQLFPADEVKDQPL